MNYEIRIRGKLSSALTADFERLDVAATPEPAATILTGQFEDRAALHELLRRIESYGLELVEVHRAPEGARIEQR